MFDFITHPLLNALFAIYAVIPGHDFGIAVIILTLIIRFILWPITGKQLHSQKKMQQLQPEIVKLRAQAGGDKTKENQLLMQLYKEKEINPFSACLPLLVQFPFLIALFFVFKQSALPIAKFSSFLYEPVRHLSFIQDLITGHVAYHPSLLGIVSMAKPNIVLAVIAGITQYIQVKMLAPKQIDPNDQQARVTNTMNYLFPALTFFIALSLPAALPLYWISANTVAILQQWLAMRGEVHAMEEAIIVEDTPSLPSKTQKKSKKKPNSKRRK